MLVLVGFLWLVVRHNEKLDAPKDFKIEPNWARMQLETVASLAVAKSGNVATTNGIQVDDIISAVERAGAARRATPDAAGRHRRILRVDDMPQDDVWERQAFEAQGHSFSPCAGY